MLLARAARRKALREEISRADNAQEPIPEPEPQTTSASVYNAIDFSSCESSERCSVGANAGQKSETESDIESIGAQRISIEELRGLSQANERVVILDVRTERTFDTSDSQARGSVRLQPDHVAERAKELDLDKEAWLIAYCA